MFDTRVVGKKIAELRKAKNMTQMELADTMGVSYQAVSNWERGNSMPDISKLPDLVRIFDCSIDELLSSSEETELLNNIIAGNTEEYVQKHQVTVETVSKAAPILKPNQTKSILEMIINENIDSLTVDELIGIAPFVEEEFLDKWIEKVDVVENIKELIGLAPFLSEETLDKLVKQLTDIGDIRDIIGLAPFLSEGTLDELVNQLGDVASINDIVSLAPFLSEETLDKLILEIIEEGKIEEWSGLYPFLGKETLYNLADILVKKYGFNAIRDLAIFL